MCPCPFCASVLVLLSPLLLFKKPRSWLMKKLKYHHGHCETCQKAEHASHMADHTPCTCRACLHHKTGISKTQRVASAKKKKSKRSYRRGH